MKRSITDVSSNWVNNTKFTADIKRNKLDQNMCCKKSWLVLLQETIFPVPLPPNNSLFLYKSGTFQRLNGFNEPQCCASVGCWVSGMKLMMMCPAECHSVFPTVMVMVSGFFYPLTEGGCCFFGSFVFVLTLLFQPSALISYLYTIISPRNNAVQ